MNRVLQSALVTVAFVVTAAQAAHAAEKYTVSAEARHNSALIGTPVVVVDNGVVSTMRVSGDQGYSYSVRVSEAGPETVNITAKFVSGHGSIAPAITTRLGQPVSVSVGAMHLTLTVRASGT